MKTFSLKKPCKDCPFLKDGIMLKSLGSGRMESIIETLKDDGTFPCHKTIDYNKKDSGKMDLENEKFCAGAMGYVHNNKIPHQMLQVAERLEVYEPNKLEDLDKIIGPEDLKKNRIMR